MKIGGVTVTPPEDLILPIPRGSNFLVFRIRPLPDMDEFEKFVKEPSPPAVLTKDGKKLDTDEPGYKQQLANYAKQKLGYMVIKSLEPSDIEWETVDPENPSTWINWQEDFKNAGFTSVEVNTIFNFVLEANTLSEEKLKKARESFLLGQAQSQRESTGLHTEPANTQSGEPATASA